MNIPFELVDADPILNQIGNTPLIVHPCNDRILAKNERQNPTLSHKDRLGVGMILGLREMGELTKGQRVVEASSGNTAGGVALAANRLNHPCTIVMKSSTSQIKQGFVKSLGADIISTPEVDHDDSRYYQNVAQQYAKQNDAVYINQYERPLNKSIHFSWTGPELYKQIRGKNVTHIVGAVSTCGIMSGIAEYIKSQDSAIQMIGVDGLESNIHREFHGKDLGDYNVGIEGLGQWRVTDTANLDVFDDIIAVSDSAAIARAKHEAKNNALLIGLSSGAALEVAWQLSKEDSESKIVFIIHDGPEKYFNQISDW